MANLGERYRKQTVGTQDTTPGGVPSSLGEKYRKGSRFFEQRPERPEPVPVEKPQEEKGFFKRAISDSFLEGKDAFGEVVGMGFNSITDKLSKTKFFQEAGAGLEIEQRGVFDPVIDKISETKTFQEIGMGLELEAQAGEKERKIVTGLGAASLSASTAIDTFVAEPLNFATRSIWGKETAIGKMYADTARGLAEISRTSEEIKRVQETPFSIKSLKDPSFWITTAATQIPITIGFFAVASKVKGATSTLSFLRTSPLGKVGANVVSNLAGGGAMRGFEASVEAEETYKQAKQMGMSEERAVEASKNVFVKNLSLSGLDAFQIALALQPYKFGSGSVVGKILTSTGKLAAAGATEGAEEAIQLQFQKSALGEDFDITSPESKESLFIGSLMGILFQAGGNVSQSQAEKIQREYADNVASNLAPELQEEYNKLNTTQGRVNFLERQARQNEAEVQSAVLQTELSVNSNVKNTKEAVNEIKQYVKPEELAQEDVTDLGVEETATQVAPELQPLIQEARKYKSAEEFIEASGARTIRKVGDIEYKVDSLSDPKFFTAFQDGKQVGKLSLSSVENFRGQSVRKVNEVVVDESLRGQGIATELYKNAKNIGNTDILSQSPDVIAPKQIQRIREKLGAKALDEDNFIIRSDKTSLTSLWEEANRGEVGEKVSKVAKSVEQKAIERGLTKGFEGLAGFDPITIKEQASLAAEVIKNREKTLNILKGIEPLPDGLRGAALLTAAENKAVKNTDAEMLQAIANSPLVSETSAAAQELRLLAEREPDSATAKMQEIKKAREEAFRKQNKLKPEKAVKLETKKIKKEIKKSVSTRESWDEFVTNLTC